MTDPLFTHMFGSVPEDAAPNDNPKFVSGAKTMADGTRVPITSDEAADLWRMVEDAQAARAKAYPATQDALRAFIDADARMSDLGWRTSIFDLVDGEALAVAEKGSTGIFSAIWRKPYLHYHDCVAHMGKHYIKRASDLTADEREKMDACARDHSAFMDGQAKMMQRLQDAIFGGEKA